MLGHLLWGPPEGRSLDQRGARVRPGHSPPSQLLTWQSGPVWSQVSACRGLPPPSVPHSPGWRKRPTLRPPPRARRAREAPGPLPGEASGPRFRGVSSQRREPRAPARRVYARRLGNSAGPPKGWGAWPALRHPRAGGGALGEPERSTTCRRTSRHPRPAT